MYVCTVLPISPDPPTRFARSRARYKMKFRFFQVRKLGKETWGEEMHSDYVFMSEKEKILPPENKNSHK